MILRTNSRPPAYYVLKKKLKAVLKTAPVFASFSVNTENGTLSVFLRDREDLPLEERQFVQCFNPYHLTEDDGTLVNSLVDSTVEYLEGVYPKFKYTIRWEEDPSEEDLASLEDFTSLESVKVSKEQSRNFVLTKLFIKKDFFVAKDTDEPKFTCGFTCNMSSIDFLSKFYSGSIAEESIPDYLEYVPNPKDTK